MDNLMIVVSIGLSILAIMILALIVAAHSWLKNFWSDPNTWAWSFIFLICAAGAVLAWTLRKW